MLIHTVKKTHTKYQNLRMKFDIPDGDLKIQIFEAKGKKLCFISRKNKKDINSWPLQNCWSLASSRKLNTDGIGYGWIKTADYLRKKVGYWVLRNQTITPFKMIYLHVLHRLEWLSLSASCSRTHSQFHRFFL